jgi:hypothetical protein
MVHLSITDVVLHETSELNFSLVKIVVTNHPCIVDQCYFEYKVGMHTRRHRKEKEAQKGANPNGTMLKGLK